MAGKSPWWQFGLQQLLLVASITPLVAGVAGGTFGDAAQSAFWALACILLFITLFWMPMAGVLAVVLWVANLEWRRPPRRRSRRETLDAKGLR